MENFHENGFCVKKIFTEKELNAFTETYKDLLKMQMKKMHLEYKNNFNEDIFLLNEKNPNALSEVLQMARNTSDGHRLAASQSLEETGSYLLNTESKVIISGPSFFINIPSMNTRKYTWHSEQNWYPKRRNFINVWTPLIHNRIDGTSMEVCSGSHKKDWFYFSEYTGYDGKFDKDANVQYEIPDNFIIEYEKIIPDVKLTEALFFDGKLVHRSIDNITNNIFFTLVFRIFDYTNDLTLSSNWADIPYNRKSLGYPNINVKI
jgi:ectoine hydroxylase-related dioxygenase (phytanoyl-CoA dioxygenase family)